MKTNNYNLTSTEKQSISESEQIKRAQAQYTASYFSAASYDVNDHSEAAENARNEAKKTSEAFWATWN